jgi:hypothetical protein
MESLTVGIIYIYAMARVRASFQQLFFCAGAEYGIELVSCVSQQASALLK